jgi:competence protein ComEA
MSLRDRLDTLSRAELAALTLAVALTLGGSAFWYMRSLPRPVQIAAPSFAPAPGNASVAVSSPSASLSPSPVAVIVDVAGWVVHPGVYDFSAGQRVIDAVLRAGGARRGADLSAINLAAPLVDGSQIVVPRAGAGAGPAVGSGAGGVVGPGGVTMININSATQQQLETLSGVGPVLAAAIVSYRNQHGPFHSVDDLLDVSGIGPATLAELRPQVTV